MSSASSDTVKPIPIFYSERFKDHDTGRGHPEQPMRMEAIADALRQAWDDALFRWADPRPATRDELLRVHTEDHIDRIQRIAANGGGMPDPDTVMSSESYEVALLSCGASLAGVDCIFNGECERVFAASRPPGHHALADKAMGFCLFSNAAAAARHAQALGDLERVFIIDWDVHHGNGTQAIFYEDASVYYLSTHQYPHYPGTGKSIDKGFGNGEGYTQNLPFPAGTQPKEILDAVQAALDEISASFAPEFIIISAGFDGHRGDPLGNWLLEDQDFRTLTRMVLDMAKGCGARGVLSCLEGGYNLETLASSVVAHCQELATYSP